MRVPLNWLKELVEFDLNPQELADKLTMAGFEVEDIEDRRTWADGVVVGKILKADRHPNADKLQVCRVDVGTKELQIVCGAANARSGLFVPVAMVGTLLPRVGEGLRIKASKLRGEQSEGMICSLSELGLEKESAGIYEFPSDVIVGADVRPLLGLEDVILDVTSTANRADALSMVGIAREVAALTGGALHLPQVELLGTVTQQDWLTIEDAKACPAYIGSVIESVTIGNSPDWLQQKLKACGTRPINNVVDITNYILLLWGQPLHSFDRDRLGEDLKIGVRFARKGEQLQTLDGQGRKLEPVNLVITTQDYPVALAGVMGGEASGVSNKTCNILLEAALFDQAIIRRSARAQGLRSEASARYERGVNHAALEIATAHALNLIETIAGGKVIVQGICDQRQSLTRSIGLTLSHVRAVLGPVTEEMNDLSAETVEETLTRLGFAVNRLEEEDNNVIWQVEVPAFRHADIERPIDLIEEVARIYGYDKFTENLPPLTEGGYLPEDQEFLRDLRSSLRGIGLTEVLHNSLRLPAETQDQQVIITNPIAHEYSALRVDLITGLIDSCVFNLSQGNGLLSAFEIGRVFWLEEGEPMEADHLGGILGTNLLTNSWRTKQNMDWFMAKGLLETVFQRLNLHVEFQPDRKDTRLHPGRTASLWIDGNRLGTFGQLHPQLRAERELPEEIYVFELDLELVYDIISNRSSRVFQNFSTFPPSDRDIAFFAKIDTSVGEIQRWITHSAGDLLESVCLFDEYRGEGVPDGCRSLAFRLVYRLNDRTLTDEDVNPVHQKVRDMLEERFEVTLRS